MRTSAMDVGALARMAGSYSASIRAYAELPWSVTPMPPVARPQKKYRAPNWNWRGAPAFLRVNACPSIWI